jgi:mono/diheme cytochrome c family protein
MSRPAKLVPLAVAALATVAAACGSDHIEVAQKSPMHAGALLFSQRCAGCHTLDAAATHGSAANIRTRERNDGPNFNVRCETSARVLYAIRNGGFSGAIMPQNIVVGPDADAVAKFVARYAGRKATNPPAPTSGGNRSSASRGAAPPKNQPVSGKCGVSGKSG